MAATHASAVDLGTTEDTTALAKAALDHVNAGEFEAARPLIQRALALKPDDGVLAHVKAHLTSDSGVVEDGAVYLRHFLATHDPHDGINVHIAFHLALHELELARPAAALDWYVRVVAPWVPRVTFTFFSAATILWRMELTGYAQQRREAGAPLPWEQLRDTGLGIEDVNGVDAIACAVALLASGDRHGLDTVRARLQPLAATQPLITEVVLPFIAGLEAFWDGDNTAAIAHLAPAAPSFIRLTYGPDQRCLLEDTLLEAQLRSGHFGDAAAVLGARLTRVPLPRYHFLLGRAQLGLGQRAAATASFRTALRGWRHAEPGAPEVAALHRYLAAPVTQPVV